jgi:hypothetical protein
MAWEIRVFLEGIVIQVSIQMPLSFGRCTNSRFYSRTIYWLMAERVGLHHAADAHGGAELGKTPIKTWVSYLCKMHASTGKFGAVSAAVVLRVRSPVWWLQPAWHLFKVFHIPSLRNITRC